MKTKSNALQALLGANKYVTRDVPMARLGVNFTVKAVDRDVIERARQESTFGNGKGGKELNADMFAANLIVKTCAEPDFSDAALIEHYGAEDAADCVSKALLDGEIKRLFQNALEVNGYGDAEVDFPN
ncbi:hypothetical protein BBD42_15635 [Paenibacillus sp. BIHB 4019]|uniref:Phage portal protein n=1 Tax=Paenibacillus sp. BIHB 4019 TaxID=1870819 RepID=A0A1B2DJ51_9BACL|nr:hypothetical protein [Paenibacillus sp. BIHB 4019]ANY67738.1 hypothetical protein BBD42_15635 [Paenibacillus sp. BIHB 4019]